MFGRVENNEQLGLIFQNFIYNKINKEVSDTLKSVNFWRTKEGAEVDFIIRDGLTLLPIEVKFSSFSKPEIARSLRSFINEYKPKEAKVINISLNSNESVADTKIIFIPYYKTSISEGG
jgi:hypothetical protein